MSISWAPPQSDRQNGIVLHYLVTVTSALDTIMRNVSSSQHSVVISGLKPYTLHNCTLQAETIGLGPPSLIVQVQTPEDGMESLFTYIGCVKHYICKQLDQYIDVHFYACRE